MFLYVRWLNLARIFQQKLFDGKILSQPPDFLKKNMFQNGFQEIFSGQGWRGQKKKKKEKESIFFITATFPLSAENNQWFTS